MLISRAATDVEPLRKENRSEEDRETVVSLVHLGFVTFVLRLSQPRNIFSDLCS